MSIYLIIRELRRFELYFQYDYKMSNLYRKIIIFKEIINHLKAWHRTSELSELYLLKPLRFDWRSIKKNWK